MNVYGTYCTFLMYLEGLVGFCRYHNCAVLCYELRLKYEIYFCFGIFLTSLSIVLYCIVMYHSNTFWNMAGPGNMVHNYQSTERFPLQERSI
jgi:hypothetical protein